MAASERSQTAVGGLLMIEGRAAAKVPRLDECHTQSAARRVVRGRKPVDAAAHDEQIELVGVEP